MTIPKIATRAIVGAQRGHDKRGEPFYKTLRRRGYPLAYQRAPVGRRGWCIRVHYTRVFRPAGALVRVHPRPLELNKP